MMVTQDIAGIVILPAGRDEAFADYKQFIQNRHPIDDVESFLNDDDLELFRAISDTDRGHVWGTSVDGTWRNVERNDIVLVYHDGGFVARGQALQSHHDPDLVNTSGRRASDTIAGTTRAPGSI